MDRSRQLFRNDLQSASRTTGRRESRAKRGERGRAKRGEGGAAVACMSFRNLSMCALHERAPSESSEARRARGEASRARPSEARRARRRAALARMFLKNFARCPLHDQLPSRASRAKRGERGAPIEHTRRFCPRNMHSDNRDFLRTPATKVITSYPCVEDVW